MSTEFSDIILFYGGQLSIDENFILTFTGGRNRPMRVPVNLKLEELKSKIKSSLQIDSSTYSINLTCNYPFGPGFVATLISDDEVCGVILDKASRQTLGIYVELERCGTSYSAANTIMLDPPNTVEYVQHTISSAATNTIPIRSSGFCEPGQSEQYAFPPNAEVDDYETMDSSSSSSPENSDSDEELEFAETGGDDVIHEHNLIRDHSLQNVQQERDMIMNNDYVHICQTAREWDADEGVDEPFDITVLSDDIEIPTELVEGMCFSSKINLQFAIAGWSILNNVQYAPITSNQKNLTLVCAQRDDPGRSCKWRAHCSSSKRLGGAWRVAKIAGYHTCVNVASSGGHPQCTSKLVAYFILPALRRQIDMKPREIIGRMESKFNISVSYMKAWDARRKAIKTLFGSWEESYRSLFLFMESICSVIPGTIYKIHTTSTNRFQRIFWAFGPSCAGWRYCRPVLCLDGTFLLGKFRGTLLSAIGIDANNGLFSLAFAVVEAECNESWQWFLLCIRDCLPHISSRPDLCFISDKHAGLLHGCREIFPSAAHRHCLRYLRENFKKTIRKMGIGDVEFMCQKMYMAGNTDDVTTFNRLMVDIINVKADAYNWLIQRDVTKWTLLHDGGMRYGSMTTNAAECFNSVLKRARGLPIQALITAIYYNIIAIYMKRYHSATEQLQLNDSPFAQRTHRLLQRYEREARSFPQPIDINRSELQVFDRGSRSFQVQISTNNLCSCTCGRCELYHLPCAHAIVALGHRRLSYTTYVSKYYSLDFYKNTYADEFHCLPDRSNWPGYNYDVGLIELLPPASRRRAGRPRTNRFRNTMDETSSKRKCSFCNSYGHYRISCPHNPSRNA